MSKNLISALLVFGACAAAQPQPAAIAIRNVKIVTVSGPAIDKGAVVLRDGLIESVGANVTPPPDAMVIEGEGLTVYPGLIDALSTWGMPDSGATNGRGGRGGAAAPAGPRAWGPEDRPQTTSWIKAADLMQPNDRRFEAARDAGFTTAVAFPTSGIFGGQGSIVNLAGEKTADMVLVPSVGQYIALHTSPFGAGFPSSLMGVIAYVRQIYLDAGHYQAVKAAYDRDPRGMKRPDYDRALEGVIESKRILLPANRWVEIERMVRFGEELKQPTILYGMREGFDPRSVDHLKGKNMPVLVSLKWPEAPRDANPDDVASLRVLEDRDKAPAAPAVLHQAGLAFAFYSDGIDQTRDLERAVKKAIDGGLPREAAVRALTLTPAEIYGVADRLGSIEKGKIANLVVTRGEIFEDRTKVEMVFIDGVKHTPAPQTGGRGAAATENHK
ncbi:MAG TPA: amidohydrolase family protein [Bryobacteraceae bacterium]|nr:amidohydrolase family protein [Bryobacteraceae bacterium]